MQSRIIPNKENLTWLLYWMCERMNIFWRKYRGDEQPWTSDPILSEYSFTNVYRCLDRVSQYLIWNVLYNGRQYTPEDVFFRVLLFKHFNKIETWQLLEKEFGDIRYNVDTGAYLEEIADYVDTLLEEGVNIYNSAYIVTGYFYQLPEYSWMEGLSKHRAYFRVFQNEIFGNDRLWNFLRADSFEALYREFRSMRIYGDFIAQQYTIDLNYSSIFNFTENDFVVTGPGSLRGIRWVFEGANGKKYDYVGAIRWLQSNFEELMHDFCRDSGMTWNPLPWEPVPTLTNLQNCFCEISKYAKGLGATFKSGSKERIKRVYSPHGGLEYVFPPKWGKCELPDRNSVLLKNI